MWVFKLLKHLAFRKSLMPRSVCSRSADVSLYFTGKDLIQVFYDVCNVAGYEVDHIGVV